jgi:hypothetical protein
MTVSFASFNEEIIDALGSNRERIAPILDRQAARLIEEGGHLLHFLPVNFIFDERECAALGAAAATFVDLQTKMLRHFAATIGRAGILDTFRVPGDMRRFVNWDELLDPEYVVGRFDILQAQDGYQFCEFNIDSCVAAAEIFEFAEDYLRDLGVNASRIAPPLSDLAALVARTVQRTGAARAVILDWSVGGGSPGKGYLSFERMRRHIAQAIAPLPAFIADEKTFHPSWLSAEEAPRTLVIRGYMMDEMDDGGEFLDRLLSLGAPVFNTYESEIRMNKLWFALFHDPDVASILTQAERDLIARYIPYTCEIDERNRARLIADKDRYFFKEKQNFGGKGIHEGASTSAEDLEALLKDDGARRWTAQQVIRAVPAEFPHDGNFRRESQNLVFGMYLYGRKANGMLVRASTRSKIVNVTAGSAKLAWAFCVNDSMKAAITSAAAKARRVANA